MDPPAGETAFERRVTAERLHDHHLEARRSVHRVVLPGTVNGETRLEAGRRSDAPQEADASDEPSGAEIGLRALRGPGHSVLVAEEADAAEELDADCAAAEEAPPAISHVQEGEVEFMLDLLWTGESLAGEAHRLAGEEILRRIALCAGELQLDSVPALRFGGRRRAAAPADIECAAQRRREDAAGAHVHARFPLTGGGGHAPRIAGDFRSQFF